MLILEMFLSSSRLSESLIGLSRNSNSSMFWGRKSKLKYIKDLFQLKRRNIRRIQISKSTQVLRKILRFKKSVDFLLKIKVSNCSQLLDYFI